VFSFTPSFKVLNTLIYKKIRTGQQTPQLQTDDNDDGDEL
jgi:hypothetical protein